MVVTNEPFSAAGPDSEAPHSVNRQYSALEDILVNLKYGKMCRTRMLGVMATAGRPYSHR